MTPIEKSLWLHERWIRALDPVDGDEIFAEVALRALKRYGEMATLPRSLVVKIVRSVQVDLSRAKLRNSRFSLPLIDDVTRDDSFGDQVRRAEDRQYIIAIATLVPPLERVVLLRSLDGQSYEEIAEACGISVIAVRSRLQRARNHLRRMIEQAEKN